MKMRNNLKNSGPAALSLLLALACAVVFASGCGESSEEKRSDEEIRASAAAMDEQKLRERYELCRKRMEEKSEESGRIASKISAVPLEELQGETMRKLKEEYNAAEASLRRTGEVLEIYASELESRFRARQ